ncbi:uncharacterized protein L199_006242 [Kwoniella botswanensis]|uniref:uncharacterized protein n=1 Tax=Kwoniella botswanensis TaxID=1268659 RepID=UPI00315D97DE
MSSSRPKVNLRSTAVKRIMQEASELANADIEEDGFVAAPLEDDIFEWHCTMRGVSGSEYDGGLYHLRILLPPSYPMSAPDIMLMTPNGRFELGKKICIDGLTSFHAGSWQPAWGVRTAVVGLRSFWMQTGEALSAIGALDYSKEERRRLANLSKDWRCPNCGVTNQEIIPPSSASPSSSSATQTERQALSHVHDQASQENGDSLSEVVSVSNDRGEKDQSDISIDPNPQEMPSILPPFNTSTIGPSSTGLQALPIDIIPPSIEEPPSFTSTRGQSKEPGHSTSVQGFSTTDERGIPSPIPTHSISPPTTSPAIDTSSNRETNINANTNANANTNTDANSNAATAPVLRPNQQRSPAFYLLDSLILAGISILIMLIAKRMA